MVQFASYLRRVLAKTRLIFSRINGPNIAVLKELKAHKKFDWSAQKVNKSC